MEDLIYCKNPVLNSSEDITDELIQRIINNDLDSLTINYEFTRKQNEGESTSIWMEEQYRTNPFLMANNEEEIRRIEFEIILGERVNSRNYLEPHPQLQLFYGA